MEDLLLSKLRLSDIDWDSIIKNEVHTVFANMTNINDKYSDCVLNDYIANNKESIRFCHKLKYIQMKLGAVWQNLMGYIEGVENLGVGHYSGLDLKSSSFIMELKNSNLTDNASSRKHNVFKLKEFVRCNPGYIPIYGFINDNKNPDGRDEVKDGIRYLSGRRLLKFMFGDQYEIVLATLRKYIKELLDA